MTTITPTCKHEKLTDPPMQSGQYIVATCPDCGAVIVYQCVILKSDISDFEVKP